MSDGLLDCDGPVAWKIGDKTVFVPKLLIEDYLPWLVEITESFKAANRAALATVAATLKPMERYEESRHIELWEADYFAIRAVLDQPKTVDRIIGMALGRAGLSDEEKLAIKRQGFVKLRELAIKTSGVVNAEEIFAMFGPKNPKPDKIDTKTFGGNRPNVESGGSQPPASGLPS